MADWVLLAVFCLLRRCCPAVKSDAHSVSEPIQLTGPVGAISQQSRGGLQQRHHDLKRLELQGVPPETWNEEKAVGYQHRLAAELQTTEAPCGM